MRTFETWLHATSDTATAVLHVASISVAVGAVAAACTQQLRYGIIVAIAAFVCAGAGFGFHLWRTYGPPQRRQSFMFGRKLRRARG
jgi:hypothetical protein